MITHWHAYPEIERSNPADSQTPNTLSILLPTIGSREEFICGSHNTSEPANKQARVTKVIIEKFHEATGVFLTF